MRKGQLLVIGMVLGLSILLLVLEGAEGRTITVDDDGEAEFTSIQDAINASEDGDTVRVWDGIYIERLYVDREISIIGNGSDSTILEWFENTDVIWIMVDNVSLQAFSVHDAGHEPPIMYSSIRVEGNNSRISDVSCSGSDFGIVLSYWSNNSVINSTFWGNGVGAYVRHTSNVLIQNCTFSENDRGISSHDISNVTIQGCSFEDNVRGIYTESEVSGIMIRSNVLTENEIGISLRGAVKNISILQNLMQYCNVGMAIYDSESVKIEMNTIHLNGEGVRLSNANDTHFTNNSVRSNIIGIWFYISDHCSIHFNTIMNNSNHGLQAYNNFPYVVDARFNFWGDTSGPYNPDKNQRGTGDAVGKYTDFRPWQRHQGDMEFTVGSNDDDDDRQIPYIPIFITISLIGSGFLSITYFREDLRYLLLALLTAPLYSKLEKDDILEQPNRQEIYSFVVNKPGSNLTKLHKELPIGYGTLVHHLKVLEREKHIRSKKEMGRKLFFPTGTDWLAKKENSAISPTPREESSAESENIFSGVGGGPDPLENLSSVPVGLRIIEYLKESGPATQKELAETLEVGLTSVSYNLRNLVDEGRVVKGDEKGGATYELLKDDN